MSSDPIDSVKLKIGSEQDEPNTAPRRYRKAACWAPLLLLVAALGSTALLLASEYSPTRVTLSDPTVAGAAGPSRLALRFEGDVHLGSGVLHPVSIDLASCSVSAADTGAPLASLGLEAPVIAPSSGALDFSLAIADDGMVEHWAASSSSSSAFARLRLNCTSALSVRILGFIPLALSPKFETEIDLAELAAQSLLFADPIGPSTGEWSTRMEDGALIVDSPTNPFAANASAGSWGPLLRQLHASATLHGRTDVAIALHRPVRTRLCTSPVHLASAPPLCTSPVHLPCTSPAHLRRCRTE